MNGEIVDGKLEAPDSTTISHALDAAGFGSTELHLFDQLESTSLWLRKRVENQRIDGQKSVALSKRDSGSGLAAAQLCATHWQSSGIARRGRGWQTKPGNITFSLLSETLRKPNELLGLSLVTGIGVVRCLNQECGVQPQLKWPNDVILNEAKLGGLLTELMGVTASNSAESCTRILTGIGINVLHDEQVQGLGIGATSLQAVGVKADHQYRDCLLGKLAGSVLEAHEQFFEEGWAPFASQWKTLDWLLDKRVSIHRDDSVEHAVARGVNEQGALMVQRDGKLQPVYGGEVSIRPVE